jgi:hypothetical protein
MIRHRSILLGVAALGLGCGKPAPAPPPPAPPAPAGFPVDASEIVAMVDSTPVRGGFGSSIAAVPLTPNYYVVLTDRGPNYDVAEDTKAFAVPRYSPRVGWVRRTDSTLAMARSVSLSNADGSPITGLPSPAERGGTGEKAVGVDGTRLPADPNGLDPEGIHPVQGGSFWVSDEYGPSLVHFDSTGRTLERFSPRTAGKALPKVFAKRRPNRGMEGLSGTLDGTTLIGLMQSPLDNPKAAGRVSTSVRILAFEPGTGKSRQYLYPLDSSAFVTSDITALGGTRYLVIEHDALGQGASRQRKIYRIDLGGATDVSDPQNGAEGLLVNGKTIEALTPSELAAAAIRPVTKKLVADLLALGYPHDKPEGLVVLSLTEIGVINDDDFGITEGPGHKPVTKMAAPGVPDRSELWVVRLAAPLAP